jgi:hypothetical protein
MQLDCGLRRIQRRLLGLAQIQFVVFGAVQRLRNVVKEEKFCGRNIYENLHVTV